MMRVYAKPALKGLLFVALIIAAIVLYHIDYFF